MAEEKDYNSEDTQRLETLAFHFTQVCKRLSQDREHWAETGKDLNKAVNNLNATLQKFAELEKQTKEQVAAVMTKESREVARTIASSLNEKTQEVFTKQTKEAADYLGRVLSNAKDTLEDYQLSIGSIRKWFLIGIIFSSLIGNIVAGLGVYYFLADTENNNAITIIKEIRAIERKEKIPTPSATHRSKIQSKLLK